MRKEKSDIKELKYFYDRYNELHQDSKDSDSAARYLSSSTSWFQINAFKSLNLAFSHQIILICWILYFFTGSNCLESFQFCMKYTRNLHLDMEKSQSYMFHTTFSPLILEAHSKQLCNFLRLDAIWISYRAFVSV